jgi:hypothetical protein
LTPTAKVLPVHISQETEMSIIKHSLFIGIDWSCVLTPRIRHITWTALITVRLSGCANRKQIATMSVDLESWQARWNLNS